MLPIQRCAWAANKQAHNLANNCRYNLGIHMVISQKTLVASGLCGCISLATTAQADTAIIPYVETGMADYALEFDGNVPSPDGSLINTTNKFYFNLATVKLGLAVSFDSFSLNGYYQTTSEDSDVQVSPIPGLPTVKWDGNRDSMSLAAGYNLSDAFAISGGYRDSEISGGGSFNSRYSFIHDGWFLSSSYRLGLTETGGLTFSLGYAWLDAELDETFVGLDLGKNSGDGSGAKLGVVWQDFFDSNWGYNVSAEYFNYDYELDPLAPGSGTIDMKESETTFRIGLFYMF